MAAPSARSRRRADAERNIARIVSAARTLLSSDPNATTDDIAQAAGVGRMTLYGHFRTGPTWSKPHSWTHCEPATRS